MHLFLAICSILIGLALLFEGYRAARIVIPLAGFLWGLTFGGAVISAMNSTPFLGTVLGVLVGLGAGVLLAVLAYFWYYLAVVVLAGTIGYWAGSGFILLLGFSPGLFSALVGIGLGMAIGVLAVLANAPKYVLIFLTAMAGSIAATGGIMLLFRQIPLNTYSYATVNVALSHSFWWTFVALVLLITGISAQARAADGFDFAPWNRGEDNPTRHVPPTHGSTPIAGGVH